MKLLSLAMDKLSHVPVVRKEIDEHVDMKKHYNWPSEESQTWRHISSFIITDNTGNFKSVYINQTVNTEAWLWGYIIPRPGSSKPSMLIRTLISCYAIDFGKHRNDANRGLWVRSSESIWYKLELPAVKYRKIYEEDITRMLNFMKIYDTLIYNPEPISQFDDDTNMFTCKKSIEEVSDVAKGAIDLDFVRSDTDFVLAHLESVLEPTKSKNLFNSIKALGAPVNDDGDLKSEAKQYKKKRRIDTSVEEKEPTKKKAKLDLIPLGSKTTTPMDRERQSCHENHFKIDEILISKTSHVPLSRENSVVAVENDVSQAAVVKKKKKLQWRDERGGRLYEIFGRV